MFIVRGGIMRKRKIIIISFILLLLCNYLIPVVYATENLIENENKAKEEQKVESAEDKSNLENKNNKNIEIKEENIEAENEEDNEEEINFSSETLKKYLLENYDANNDGKITKFDMEKITELEIPYLGEEIIDLKGIEYATFLKKLSLANVKNLQVLTSLKDLEELEVQYIFSNDDFQAINMIENLKKLTLTSINLNEYKLSELPKNIENLTMSSCNIDNLEDIKLFSNLKGLIIYDRQYNENELIGLENINDLSNLRSLTINYLDITDINFLKDNNYIEYLDLFENKLTDISVINTMKKLKHIVIRDNNIQDVSLLEESSLIDNEQISQEIILEGYEVIQEQTLEIELPQTIKSIFNPDSRFYAEDAIIEKDWSLTGEQGVDVNEDNSKIVINANELNIGEKEERLIVKGSGSLSGSTINVKYSVRAPGDNKKEISFNNEYLKNYLIENYDIDNDNIITQFDMAQITELTIPFIEENSNIDIQGLEYATSLKKLYIANCENFKILTNLKNLEYLEIDTIYSQEDYQEIKNIPNLKSLSLSYVSLQEYLLKDLPKNLNELYLRNCELTDISEINQFTNLEKLEIQGTYSNQGLNGLDSINQLVNLKYLLLNNLELTDIDFLNNNSYIQTLDVSYNNLEDISVVKTMPNLENIYIQNNNIKDITTLRDTKFIQEYNNYAQRIEIEVECTSGEIIEIELPQTIKSALDTKDEVFGIKNLSIEQSGNLDTGEEITITRFNEDKTKLILDASKINTGNGTEYINLYGDGILNNTTISISYKILANGDKSKEVEFGDEELKNYILQNHDSDNDGKVTEYDMAQIKDLTIYDRSFKSIKGLKYAKNATRLQLIISSIYESDELIPVDLTEIGSLEKLEYLNLSGNTSNLDFLPSMANLDTLVLNISNDKPDNIYLLKDLKNLTTLDISGIIKTLEPIGNLSNLNSLSIEINYNVTTKDLGPLKNLKKLEELHIRGNLEEIQNFETIGEITSLKSFSIYRYESDNNKEIDYSPINKLSNLLYLDIIDYISNFDCSLINPTNLEVLNLQVNSLLNADEIANCNKLYSIYIVKSKLTNMNFVRNLNLQNLTLSDNLITDLSPIENLNAHYVDLSNNPIDPSDEENARIIKLYEGKNLILTDYEKTKKLEFKDENFKNDLIKSYDINGDGEISIYEMEQIVYLSVSNLEHAEYLTNLERLYINTISL